MVRLCVAVVSVLLLATQAGATLVVVVPSGDGLVVAADSRESITGQSCDGLFKIVPANNRTVVVVTGDPVFVRPAPPASAKDARSVCAYLRSAPRLLDMPAFVVHYLEQHGRSFQSLSIDDLGAACVAAVQRFQSAHGDALQSYAGRDIFSVVIAHYDPRTSTSTLLNFVVRMDRETRAIRLERSLRTSISSQERRGVWAFGETDYLNENVFRGAGRKYLRASTQNFILDEGQVNRVREDQAVGVARDVIRAATRIAQEIPPPSGIGGPIRVFVVGRKQRPVPFRPAEP